MLEEFDGKMIEIGDPAEEPAAPEPPARVVIEYRERGVPWMLIPPLLVISAAGAILAYHKLAPRVPRPQPLVIAKAPDRPAIPEKPEGKPEPTEPPKPTPAIGPTSAPVVDKKPFDMTPGAENPEPAPVAADPPAAVEPPPVELPAEQAKAPETPAFPRVNGLGFDPKALEAEAPADRALAPAGQEARPDDPGKAAERIAPADGAEQPREVDPDLLPPDPRLAGERRARRLAEARMMVEADRAQFLAELREICRKNRERSGPEIFKLYKRYDNAVEPSVKEKAIFLLGKTGPFAGVDREGRIKLLRSLGYPEPAIMVALFDLEKPSIGERDGPHNESEALYFAALFLLRHPPPGAGSNTRPASSTRRPAGAPASPALATPGPAR